MNYELILTPAGHLLLHKGESDETSSPLGWMRKVIDAFSSGQEAGLFRLAATRPDVPLSPSFSFWREFACCYLTRICRTPDFTGERLAPLDPLPAAEVASILRSAPPIRGGEYLNAEVFYGLWGDLDTWVRQEIASSGDGLSEWLKKHAALWHQVGRVCFHLAEKVAERWLKQSFLS